MLADGAGEVFAYALTCGVHNALTVHGHMDESGWIRNVFRAGGFAAPYGALRPMHGGFAQLARPVTMDRAGCAGWADAIALATAGLVAVCDPMIDTDCGALPTVITVPAGPVTLAGVHVAGARNNADAVQISAQLADIFPMFAPVYIQGLASLFSLPGNERVANTVQTHFIGRANIALAIPDAHLNRKTVAPYWWVEPTSVLPNGVLLTKAQSEGFGILCAPDAPGFVPWFEAIQSNGGAGLVENYVVKYRGARTCGAALHLRGNRNGAGHLVIAQADPEGFLMTGGRDMAMHVRMTARSATLADQLWRRGHCGNVAGPEALCTQSCLGVVVTHMRFNNAGECTTTRFPSKDELLAGATGVTTVVTRPEYVETAAPGAQNFEVRRNIGRAGRAVHAAALASRNAIRMADYQAMPVAFRTPTMNVVARTPYVQSNSAQPAPQQQQLHMPVAPATVAGLIGVPPTQQTLRNYHQPQGGVGVQPQVGAGQGGGIPVNQGAIAAPGGAGAGAQPHGGLQQQAAGGGHGADGGAQAAQVVNAGGANNGGQVLQPGLQPQQHGNVGAQQGAGAQP